LGQRLCLKKGRKIAKNKFGTGGKQQIKILEKDKRKLEKFLIKLKQQDYHNEKNNRTRKNINLG
jgi:hypothetical protein